MYTAQDVMSAPVVATEELTSVAEAVHIMRRHGISSLLVKPQASDQSYGIITKRDVLTKVVANDRDANQVQVGQVMSQPVLSVPPECSLQECSRLMAKARVRRIPVFVEGEPVGIVSDTDVFASVEEAGWGPRAAATRWTQNQRARLAQRLSGVVPDPEALAESILLELDR